MNTINGHYGKCPRTGPRKALPFWSSKMEKSQKLLDLERKYFSKGKLDPEKMTNKGVKKLLKVVLV